MGKVLVACEYSGIVRDAFLAKGHDALSCDLRETLQPGPHVQGDVAPLLGEPWDLVIAHPPCTYLTDIGWHGPKRKTAERLKKAQHAMDFFMECLNANAPKVCVENPLMAPFIAKSIRKHDDTVRPTQHGHASTKLYRFWLRGLPPLMATRVTPLRVRCLEHSRSDLFYPGIAAAMADQWGSLL
ncbi:MAG: hypothetical protein OXQ29_11895 [Rhodospirillaceae bacterium]|nr:hypothetical protein [Rhodospirillaceae bacterium]